MRGSPVIWEGNHRVVGPAGDRPSPALKHPPGLSLLCEARGCASTRGAVTEPCWWAAGTRSVSSKGLFTAKRSVLNTRLVGALACRSCSASLSDERSHREPRPPQSVYRLSQVRARSEKKLWHVDLTFSNRSLFHAQSCGLRTHSPQTWLHR